MAKLNWNIKGEYFESCNCDYLCSCLSSQLQAKPTKGHCDVTLAFHITQGHYADVSLDDLSFIVVARTPGPMADGDWTVGLIIDDRADETQQQALSKIASGEVGGPMAGLAPLIGNLAGVVSKPITFEKDGMRRSVSAGDLVDQAVEGVNGTANPDEPIYLDNTLHPANPRLALAKATRGHIHAFGIDWDDVSGKNNGHFAPFDWQAN